MRKRGRRSRRAATAPMSPLPRRTFGGFFASLFGGGGGETRTPRSPAPPPSTRKQWAALAPRNARGAQADYEGGGEEGAVEQPSSRRARNQIARAEADLPRGETAMTATGAVAVAPPSAHTPETAAPGSDESAAPQEETKAPKYARVPLPPPGRPASLDRPAPLDEKPAEVASAEPGPAQESRGAADVPEIDAEASAGRRRFVNAPTPPHRPARLIAAAPAAPDAPAQAERPVNAAHAIAHVVDRPEEPRNKDEDALAYAPRGVRTAAPPPAEDGKPAQKPAQQKADLVPARLDRSNFNALTAATPAARASTRSVMGAPITAVRSAARAAEPSVLLPPARPGSLAGFAAPSAPPADKFAPSGARPRLKSEDKP